MNRTTLALAAALLALCASSCQPKVMARFVPERADDFVWENDLVCYRAYGKALEGNPTTPGFDMWCKLPGKLVADQRYRDELESGKSYHLDWGNGKDCYKVGTTLGAGGSCPFVDSTLCFPATNYREWEIVSRSPHKVVFTLTYPEWKIGQIAVSLRKTITVRSGSYFCDVCDEYDFTGTDSLTVAAGIVRHEILEETFLEDGCAIWEKASDTHAEPEEGLIGIAVRMQNPDSLCIACGHSLSVKKIASGEPVRYRFASCWSKGEIKTALQWFQTVSEIE